MGLMEEFDTVKREYPQFRASIAKARDLTTNDGTRRHLEHLLSSMDGLFGEFQESFPRAVQEIDATFAKASRTAEQALALVEQAELQIAARARADGFAAQPTDPATRIEPMPQPVDIEAVRRLQQELLDRFVPAAVSAEGVWHLEPDIWESLQASATSPARAAAE